MLEERARSKKGVTVGLGAVQTMKVDTGRRRSKDWQSLTYLCVTYLLIYLLTHLLTPWSRVLLEKPTGSQLVKKFPALYGTWRFITAFTSARHLLLSWANSIQSIPPNPTSWRSILILSSHLCLGLPSGLFPSGLSTKPLYTPLISPIRATCPAHLIDVFVCCLREINDKVCMWCSHCGVAEENSVPWYDACRYVSG